MRLKIKPEHLYFVAFWPFLALLDLAAWPGRQLARWRHRRDARRRFQARDFGFSQTGGQS